MTREEAIELLEDLDGAIEDNHGRDYDEAFRMAIEALSAEIIYKPDYSYEADMAKRLKQAKAKAEPIDFKELAKRIREVSSNAVVIPCDAAQSWRTGKPTKNGRYAVTLDLWGHRRINIMHYGKPQLPSQEVDGACWYMCDSEWGDVVYDDEDILAWMPLPEPYKGGVK